MKRALITGASSGIGAELAKLLSQKGYQLILTGRNAERLQAFPQAEIIVADLQYDRNKVIQVIHEKVPDIVINNAGFGIYGPATASEVSEQLAILQVNAEAVLEITLEAAKALEKAGKSGTILNVSSAAGEQPTPGMSVYGAAKAFVTQVSQALNTELEDKNIRVLVCCPGMVATEFANRAAKKHVDQKGGPIMTASFVAQEIWRQIENGQEKRIVNWSYRLGSWFSTRFLPQSWIKKIIWKNIQKRF